MKVLSVKPRPDIGFDCWEATTKKWLRSPVTWTGAPTGRSYKSGNRELNWTNNQGGSFLGNRLDRAVMFQSGNEGSNA